MSVVYHRVVAHSLRLLCVAVCSVAWLSVQRAVSSLTWLTLRATLTGALVTTVLILSFFSSVFWYTFFYSLFIPQLSLELPVTFDFSRPQPASSVSLLSPQWSYTSLPPLLSLSSSAASSASKSPLYPLQAYDVLLRVTVPDTASNARLGVITLHSSFMHRTTALASSTHSFLPPYRSRLIRMLYELVYAIPLTLGLWSESHSVDIMLYERYKEPPAALASTHLVINITSPQAGKLQLYAATLTLSARLTGMKYLMQKYRVTAAIVGVALGWSVHVAVLLVVTIACLVSKHDEDEEDEEESRAKFVGGVEGLMLERAASSSGSGLSQGDNGSAGEVDVDRELRGYRLDGENGESEVGERKDDEEDVDLVVRRRRHKPSH